MACLHAFPYRKYFVGAGVVVSLVKEFCSQSEQEGLKLWETQWSWLPWKVAKVAAVTVMLNCHLSYDALERLVSHGEQISSGGLIYLQKLGFDPKVWFVAAASQVLQSFHP